MIAIEVDSLLLTKEFLNPSCFSWLGYLDALFLLKGQFIDNRKNHQRMFLINIKIII